MVFFALIIEEPHLVFSLQCKPPPHRGETPRPTELTLVSLHSLVTLPSLGFGVGDGLGVSVRLLRLPLSLVPLVELVCPPSRSLLSTPSRVLAPASFHAVDLNSAHWFF